MNTILININFLLAFYKKYINLNFQKFIYNYLLNLFFFFNEISNQIIIYEIKFNVLVL